MLVSIFFFGMVNDSEIFLPAYVLMIGIHVNFSCLHAC